MFHVDGYHKITKEKDYKLYNIFCFPNPEQFPINHYSWVILNTHLHIYPGIVCGT